MTGDDATSTVGSERTAPPCPDCGSGEVWHKEGFITCHDCDFWANSTSVGSGDPYVHYETGEKFRYVSPEGERSEEVDHDA